MDIQNTIRTTVENGKILSLKTHRINRAVEEYILEAVNIVLGSAEKTYLVPTLYTVVKELAINACKANQKRIFFEEKNLDINNPKDYDFGIQEYKSKMTEEFSDLYGRKAKEKGYFCLISFHFTDSGLTVEVVNNSLITKEEEKSLREKLDKGMGYDDLAQFFMENADSTEGAGLGLALVLMMLKGEGIDPQFFRIFTGEEKTIARLEIPFTESFKSKRQQ